MSTYITGDHAVGGSGCLEVKPFITDHRFVGGEVHCWHVYDAGSSDSFGRFREATRCSFRKGSHVTGVSDARPTRSPESPLRG